MLTNNFNLPEVFRRAVERNSYKEKLDAWKAEHGFTDRRVITTTQLIDSPRIRLLKQRYPDLPVDVSEMLASLDGEAMHYVLEKSGIELSYLSEDIVWIEREVLGERVIVKGQFDSVVAYEAAGYQHGSMRDYKRCKVWKTVDGLPREWEQQQNVYAFMLGEQSNFVVEASWVVAWYKDWSRDKASSRREGGKGYPPTEVEEFDIPLWGYDRADGFIREMLVAHLVAEHTLPECHPIHERWGTEEGWAIIKPGAKRADKIFRGEFAIQEAYQAAKEKGYKVEHRPGEYRRCGSGKVNNGVRDGYCPVRTVCPLSPHYQGGA